MSDLFEFPSAPSAAAIQVRHHLGPVTLSERISVTSLRTGRTIEYARLSDTDHLATRELILALWEHRADIRAVLDQPSGLYGSRGGGKSQTFSDILKGLYDKMHQRHPVLRGRRGEDLTVKQLGELNRLIDALNAQYGGDLPHVPMP